MSAPHEYSPKKEAEKNARDQVRAACASYLAALVTFAQSAIKRIEAKDQRDAKKDAQEAAEKKAEAANTLYNIWRRESIPILTICLAVIALLQLCTYRDQLEVARLDQRAWIAIKELENPIKEKGLIFSAFILQNTGKTPAQKVVVRSFCRLHVGSEEISYLQAAREAEFNDHIQVPDRTVFPNETFPSTVGVHDLTPEQSNAIAEGAAIIYLAGEITYFDVTGSPHITRFFARYVYATNEWRAMKDHNTSD